AYNDDGNLDFAIADYNSDGSLNTDFGKAGKTNFSLGMIDDKVRAVAIQPDGKIVITGYTNNGGLGNPGHIFLARYNPDGSRDLTFGEGGKQSTFIYVPFDYTYNDEAYAVALQSDGKIIVAGDAETTNGYDFALARYKINGTLDSTFSSDGR